MIVLRTIGWTGNKEDMSFSCKTGQAAVGLCTGLDE